MLSTSIEYHSICVCVCDVVLCGEHATYVLVRTPAFTMSSRKENNHHQWSLNGQASFEMVTIFTLCEIAPDHIFSCEWLMVITCK